MAPRNGSADAERAARTASTTTTDIRRKVLWSALPLGALWACGSACEVASSPSSSAPKPVLLGFVAAPSCSRGPRRGRGVAGRVSWAGSVGRAETLRASAAVAAEEFQEGAEAKARREATKSALLEVFGEVAGGALGSSASVAQDEAAGAATAAAAAATEGALDDTPTSSSLAFDPVLACPSTLGDLTDCFRLYGVLGPLRYKTTAKRPGVRFVNNGIYTDFVEEKKAPWQFSRREAVAEGTFQQPSVSFLYERGWRQSFNANGFPGIDEEFKMVQAFFDGAEGGTVMDLSCGSGLMTRRLVSCGRYSRVIGGDLSVSMLEETARRFRQDGLDAPELIRCDVSRLPVRTESLDGVHAGAALHCWVKLEECLAEVYRVLKPGRGFFATTFTREATIASSRPADRSNGYQFFELKQLEDLVRGAGFEDVEVTKNGRACAIVKARKAPR